MPLFTDVPPPRKPEDWLNKMSNVVTKINLWKASRKEQRAGDPGHQLALAEGTAITPSRGSSHGGREARGLGGLIRGRMDRRDQMIASRAQRNPIAMERLRSDVRYQDRVQERKNEDVLWVVVLNEEQGRFLYRVAALIYSASTQIGTSASTCRHMSQKPSKFRYMPPCSC